MNKLDISINNKLIFDFMGKEYASWTHENRTSWISARKDLNKNCFLPFNSYKKLKYHRSWSWLMPVLNKIEKLGYSTEIAVYSPNDKLYRCSIYYIIDEILNTVRNVVPVTESDDKLECVYLACIEFIDYYNLTK